MTTIDPIFGPITGPWSIEAAAVTSLGKWAWATYLQEVEKQNGLPPNTIPPPSTFRGAADLTSFDQSEMPAVLVVAQQAQGAPEYFASVGYTQQYHLTAAVVLFNDDEDLARRNAGHYAIALAAALGQQFASDNPSLVANMLMTASPSVSLQDPTVRFIYTGEVSYDVWITPVFDPMLGPSEPIPDQGLVPVPSTVTSEDVTVTAEAL